MRQIVTAALAAILFLALGAVIAAKAGSHSLMRSACRAQLLVCQQISHGVRMEG